MNELEEWNNVKKSNDIFGVNDYIKLNPNTPFMQQALTHIGGLKQKEITIMRNNFRQYEVDKLLRLIDYGIFTERDLIDAKVTTEQILQTLRDLNLRTDLPDIYKAIELSQTECKDGHTDVYFFGTPCSGKTSIIMGLSRCNSLNVNLAASSGEYAATLQMYVDLGVTVPSTPLGCSLTIEANICNPSPVLRTNLVDMSGMDICDIAQDLDQVVTFERLDSVEGKLLRNNNRKVFFLIIDPTKDAIGRILYETIDGYDENGMAITHLEPYVITQKIFLQKIIDFFKDSRNSEMMKKVDSIHIIMTKADVLGQSIEREDKALRIFNNKYGRDILDPLSDLCKKYSINKNTRYCPQLYTFSLGKFYIGGLYEYDSDDSNKLTRVLLNTINKKTWWNKIKEIFN